MAKVLTYDKIKIENVQLYKQNELISGSEETEDAVYAMKWKMGINYTISGDDIANQGGHKEVTLTDQQKTQVKNFLVPFISDLKTELDISTELDTAAE